MLLQKPKNAISNKTSERISNDFLIQKYIEGLLLFSPTIYSFKQIIDANLFSIITLNELADYCNLSLSSFKREFTKHYNDTPANYIKARRLEKAAELLMVSNMRITAIAFECGFNDLANFSLWQKVQVTLS